MLALCAHMLQDIDTDVLDQEVRLLVGFSERLHDFQRPGELKGHILRFELQVIFTGDPEDRRVCIVQVLCLAFEQRLDRPEIFF